MEFNYKLTEEAYIDFNLYHAKNSKVINKTMTIQRILGPVIYLMLSFIASSILDIPFLFLFILVLIMSTLWYIFYPAYFYRLIKRNAMKMLREGKNEGLLGEHTMIFTEEELREISPKGELALSWSGIEVFGQDHSNFYLYNSGMSALILPKNELENSEAVSSYLTEKVAR